jgi:predicted NACHT family NTPase
MIERIRQSRHITSDHLDEVSDNLAQHILDETGKQLVLMLGTDPASTTAANLRFHTLISTIPAPVKPDSQTTTAEAAGTLETVGSFYTGSTQYQRLVILGPPGVGKTILATELMVQLLQQRSQVANRSLRARMAIPIRCDLANWDPERTLSSWLASHVAQEFQLSEPLAQAMVDQHRFIPILDGLDDGYWPTHPAGVSRREQNGYLIAIGVPLVVTVARRLSAHPRSFRHRFAATTVTMSH